MYNYSLYYKFPLINDFASHPITENLSQIALYEACSLDIFGDSTGLAWAGKNAKSSEISFEERIPVVAVTQYGRGYVFSVCDGDIFSNEYIGKQDNEILAINLVNWS